MTENFSCKVSKDITDIGFTQTMLTEFENRSLTEEEYSEIIVSNDKIVFLASSLGFEKYMHFFFQLSLNNFPKGFHIHEPCDPTEDFSSKELMLYKNEPNLDLEASNIAIKKNDFVFLMPEIKPANLITWKKQLVKDRNKGEIMIATEDNYPSPGISASGSAFYKLGVMFFLFSKLTDIQKFKIFNDLILIKKIIK